MLNPLKTTDMLTTTGLLIIASHFLKGAAPDIKRWWNEVKDKK